MERLRGIDAGFLYMETPTLHMHTLKVAVVDPGDDPLDFADVLTEIGARLPLLPPLRRRLVEVPFGFHHPVWVDDPDLDLRYHVRRVTLPAPGTRAQLEAVIGDAAGTPLDRDRPLWRMDVIDGLEDGRLAVLVKIHHAVADGAAASALLANVMSASVEESRRAPVVEAGPWRPPPLPGPWRLLRDAFVDHLRQLADLPGVLRLSLANLVSVARHRLRSAVRTPVPVLSTPRTSFNTALTPERAFATARLSLAEAREVRAAFGVTLNDVVLAVTAHALRAYLADRGELPTRPLVAGVPIGTDTSPEPRLGGNRVSNLFTTLATDVADPVERLRRISAVTAEAKTMQSLLGPETFAAWVQYTPPRPYAWFMRQYSARRMADRHPPAINLVVSNVPGPREALFVGGASLEEIYSVGPILEGIGLNVTVWSYRGELFFGLLSCRRTLARPATVAAGLGEGLAELLQAARRDPVVASGA